MPLNMGQMDKLTKLLIETDNPDGLPSTKLCEALNVDKDVLLKSIESMQERTYQLIFIKHYIDGINDFFMVKIPDGEKWNAETILAEGGWYKIYSDYYAKVELEKENAEKRKKLEEESWIATKEQAAHANKISKRANWISIVSAIIALLALLLQLFGRS